MPERSGPARRLRLCVLVGFALTGALLLGCSPSPERLTLYYSLACQACYEGAQTQSLVARANALRETLTGTRVEIVDLMTPGNGARMAAMLTDHGLQARSVAPPVLFADAKLYEGFEEIGDYFARLE